VGAKFKPYVLRSVHQPVNEEVLVVHESFHAVRVLRRPLVMPGIGYGVTDGIIMEQALPGGVWPLWQQSKTPLHSILESIKVSLLAHGGTPEAVRLFLELGALTKKEISMASEKLAGKGKTAPAKNEKPAKAPKGGAKPDKAPAAEKPAKAAPAKKGNPEALAKANANRAAASAARDGLKVQVLTEKKANPYREGTKAHATFELFKANHGKTIGAIKEQATDDHDLGYLRYADRDGHIKIG